MTHVTILTSDPSGPSLGLYSDNITPNEKQLGISSFWGIILVKNQYLMCNFKIYLTMKTHYLHVPSRTQNGLIRQYDLNISGMPSLFGLPVELRGITFSLILLLFIVLIKILLRRLCSRQVHLLRWAVNKHVSIPPTLVWPYIPFIMHWYLAMRLQSDVPSLSQDFLSSEAAICDHDREWNMGCKILTCTWMRSILLCRFAVGKYFV